MKTSIEGSNTAINGIRNEDDIIRKFNNWKIDKDAQKWLVIMEYVLSEIEFVDAIKVSGYKTDVQVQVTIKLKKVIDIENIQVKLVSNKRRFNQIDKRWVDKYVDMWNIPKRISTLLKYYTGEAKPENSKKKRLLVNEFSESEQIILLKWIRSNQSIIVSDILKGRGKFAAEWMLVAQKIEQNARWILKPMNYCLNYFGNDDVMITQRGNIRIGRITIQRKGGDAGRLTANMLQFKINPAELFD
ncbi:MAG: type II restriction endonuclease [bacterium]